MLDSKQPHITLDSTSLPMRFTRISTIEHSSTDEDEALKSKNGNSTTLSVMQLASTILQKSWEAAPKPKSGG